MSAIYDNWERIVAAVLKREQLWQLFHADSIPTEYDSSLSSSTGSSLYQTSLKNEDFVEVVSYKSVMDNGITTVVKRLRGGEGKEIIRHENEGYFCYEMDEMLMVYEYQINKHAKKVGNYSLNWKSCLRIAICIAKAIVDTHSQCNEKLKLRNKHKIDNGQKNKAATSIVIPTTSYRAPEINDSCKSSQSSDIYSFGVVLMELLTGTFPMEGNVIKRRNLVRWITQRYNEVGTLIVFEFVRVRNHTELIEMWKMLLVAIRCVEEDLKKRPRLMSDVVKMMEDVRTSHHLN